MTEEKKAIEIVKEIWQFTDYSTDKIALKVVLDLVEKLQKENEELREITNGYNSLKKDSESFGGIPLIIADEKYFNEGIFTTNFIPKDKIREAKKYIEYYLIGNLKYENCQNEFKKILKLLEEE